MVFRTLLLILLAAGFSQALTAQEAKPQLERSSAKFSLKPASMQPVQPAAFHAPKPDSAYWNTSLINFQKGIFHPGSPEKEAINAVKKEKLEQKLNDPAPQDDRDVEGVTSDPPVMFRNFQGNLFNGWYPPDNQIAISDNGFIVSVVNSNISVFNESGATLLGNKPLGDYFDYLDLTDFYYDPRVIYDPDQDRFIFVVLHGNTPAESKIIISFSESQNPMDGWWSYVFDGNFLGNNTWFDFPSIAISGEDLFISGNLFSASNVFNQAVIMQIDKQPGFSGGSVNWEYFNNVTDGFGGLSFTVAPISYGFNGSYGPGIYLVSTQSGGGTYVHLYDITGNVEDEQDIFAYEINTGSYAVPADAEQQLTNKLLDIGDCRVLSGFYADGIIHYVHIADNGGGYGGLRYNRLDVAAKSISYINIGQSQFDYAYPAIAPSGASATDKDVIIAFLRASKSSFPEFRAIGIDGGMNISSAIPIKTGEYFINVTADNTQRWGDYSGICRKHNSPTPKLWVSGCYGRLNSTYGTWIAELSIDPNASVREMPAIETGKVFPNPVQDDFTLEFESAERSFMQISLNDSQGRTVRDLFRGMVKPGLNRLSFNKGMLAPGTYYLVIRDERQVPLRTEKIIVF
jgi:hypothetical protein